MANKFIEKDWWKSKTVWFNVLACVVMVANLFGFGDFQPDPKVAEVMGTAITIVNILLRFYTSRAIK